MYLPLFAIISDRCFRIEGVLEARNRSRFPHCSAGPGNTTFSASEGFDEVDEESSESTCPSASIDSEVTATSSVGFCPADRREGDGENDDNRVAARRLALLLLRLLVLATVGEGSKAGCFLAGCERTGRRRH